MITTTPQHTIVLTKEGLDYKKKALQHYFTAAMVELTHIYSQPSARNIPHLRQRKKEAMTKLRSLHELAKQDHSLGTKQGGSELLDIYPFVKAEQLVHQAAEQVWGQTNALQQNHAKNGLIALHEKLLISWTNLLKEHGHPEDPATKNLQLQCTTCTPSEIAVWPQVIATAMYKLGYPYIRIVAPRLPEKEVLILDAKKERLIYLSMLYALNGEAVPSEEVLNFFNWLTNVRS